MIPPEASRPGQDPRIHDTGRARETCEHRVPFGDFCNVCGKHVVGGHGPPPAIGQVWCERGGEGLLEVVGIEPDGGVALDAITATWCGIVPPEDLTDVCFFWGRVSERTTALRFGRKAREIEGALVALQAQVRELITELDAVARAKPMPREVRRGE